MISERTNSVDTPMRIAPKSVSPRQDLLAQLVAALLVHEPELIERRRLDDVLQVLELRASAGLRATACCAQSQCHWCRRSPRREWCWSPAGWSPPIRASTAGRRRCEERAYGSPAPASRTTTAARCSMLSLSVCAREAVSSIRSRVSAAICTAIIPATTNTTSAVTPATCLALMLNDAMQSVEAQELRSSGARSHKGDSSRIISAAAPLRAPAASPAPDSIPSSPPSSDSACCAGSSS